MFRIINFAKLIRWIAISTALISISLYELIQKFLGIELPWTRVSSIAPWVSLVVVLLLTTEIVARFAWKIICILNKSQYPDLNGTWEGEIMPESGDSIPVRAAIKVNLFKTQIDIHTSTSKSLTLEATPAIEGGQHKLYYAYRSEPKELNWPSYNGSTIFDVRVLKMDSATILELSGRYHTSRKTIGRVRLRQTGSVAATDVSFY